MERLFLDRHQRGHRACTSFNQVCCRLVCVDDADGVGRRIFKAHPDRLLQGPRADGDSSQCSRKDIGGAVFYNLTDAVACPLVVSIKFTKAVVDCPGHIRFDNKGSFPSHDAPPLYKLE